MLRVHVNNKDEIGAELIRHLVFSRRRLKKNTIIGLVGANGEAKSSDARRIAEIVEPTFDPAKQMMIEPEKFLELINKAKKEGFIIGILDEAQTSVNARKFLSLINIAVSDVMSTFRELHPMCIIIVCPNIKWIEKNIRESLNYYGVCRLVEKAGRPVAKLKLKEVYFEHHNMDNPKVKSRKIRYEYQIGNERIKRAKLGWITVGMPNEENTKRYKDTIVKHKEDLVRTKFMEVAQSLDTKKGDNKVKNLDDITKMILEDGRIKKALIKEKDGEFKVRATTLTKLFKLNPIEAVEVESKIIERLERDVQKSEVF